MWYEFFKYALFGPGVRALWHPRVVGEENIPTEGGVILACNHIAALDPIIVASMIDRKLTYPAKKRAFCWRPRLMVEGRRVVLARSRAGAAGSLGWPY